MQRTPTSAEPERSATALRPTATPTPTGASPAAGGGFAEFVALCPFSHRLADDPIVFPGLPEHSHIHSFFGNTTSNSESTLEDLLAGGTTCDPAQDKSAYWVPTLWLDGAPIEPEEAKFYYFVDYGTPASLQPFPLGLRIVAGNSARTGPTDGPSRYKWSCRGANASSTGDFATCPDGHELEILLNFPNCWNGVDVDSADHKSHMAYGEGGLCPPTHPVPVPRLQFKLRYPTAGGPGLSLSAGSGDHATTMGRGYTMHGDFFNAWEVEALRLRVENCLHRGVKCDASGQPH